MGAIRIGTSGWSYAHWRGPFYPEDLPKRAWLGYYAERFNSAEINAAFYRIPKAGTFRAWAETVPEDFRFAVKANRYITHMKKLKDPGDSFRRMLEPLAALDDRLGPILFQLPPRWRPNLERLQAFLAGLPAGFRYAFELRDTRWFDRKVFAALEDAGAALCIHQIEEIRTPLVVTADFVYIRLHGPNAAYTGRYDETDLARWADRITGWARGGRDVYCFFDNDEAGHAAANAARMRELTAS